MPYVDPEKRKEWYKRYSSTPRGRAERLASGIMKRRERVVGGVTVKNKTVMPKPLLTVYLARQIAITTKCQLCGLSMDCFDTQDRVWGMSVDRTDNTKGYVAGNLQLVHKVCNQVKSVLPDDIIRPDITNIMRRLRDGYLPTKGALGFRKRPQEAARHQGNPAKKQEKADKKPRVKKHKNNRPRTGAT